jgi:hypothetical protein
MKPLPLTAVKSGMVRSASLVALRTLPSNHAGQPLSECKNERVAPLTWNVRKSHAVPVQANRAIYVLLFLFPMAGQSLAQDIRIAGLSESVYPLSNLQSRDALAASEITPFGTTNPAEVRMIYLVPADRPYLQFYSNAIERAVLST